MPTSLSQHAECASVYRQSYSPVTPAIYRRDKGVCSALCGARQRVLPHTEKFSFFSYTLYHSGMINVNLVHSLCHPNQNQKSVFLLLFLLWARLGFVFKVVVNQY